MSCTLNRIIPRLVPLIGLPADQIAMAVEAARRQPTGNMPAPAPAPDVVDAVLRQRSGHDRSSVATALQHLLIALIQIRNQGRADIRALDVLLAVLASKPLAGMPPVAPVVAASVWARLGLVAPDDPPPAPLPVDMPGDREAQQRVVRAAARFAPWTDAEAYQIAEYPDLAGLAWALGVDHPRIRTVVEESLAAAVAAICAGSTDSALLVQVANSNAVTPAQAANILTARPDVSDPTLLATATRSAWAAAQVLAARSDLTTDSLIAAAAKVAEYAATVLAARRDLTTPQLVAKATEDPWAAAQVLMARSDLTTDALIAAAAQDSRAAAQVLATRRDCAAPPLIAAATTDPWAAATVLAARRDLTTPQLVAKATEDPWAAATVLAARSDLTSEYLLAKAAAVSWTAAQVLMARSDLTTDALIAAAARQPQAAAQVLATQRDCAAPPLIAAATTDPWAAAQVLMARSDLTTDALIAAAARQPQAAGRVLAVRPDLRANPTLLMAVCRDRIMVHATVDTCGPYPTLWRQIPQDWQQEILRRYRCTPAEEIWLGDLMRRSPPTWTAADDAIAARFPWHHALRAVMQPEAAPD